jgi:hypothetical protein
MELSKTLLRKVLVLPKFAYDQIYVEFNKLHARFHVGFNDNRKYCTNWIVGLIS